MNHNIPLLRLAQAGSFRSSQSSSFRGSPQSFKKSQEENSSPVFEIKKMERKKTLFEEVQYLRQIE